MSSISINELKQLIPSVNIIDIRDSYQFNLGKINTARNIPMNFLLSNPSNYLNKNERYYLYCQSGSRSEKACIMLTNKGYNVVNVLGGYNEYITVNE